MRKQALHPRTASINMKQKTQAKLARHKALRWLAEKFPLAFDNRTQIQPLKTGIMHDILEYTAEAEQAGISKSKLREAVVIFTRRLDYLACIKAREIRIDLHGNPVSPVTEVDAERATQKIKKRIEKCVKNTKKQPANKAATPATKTTTVNHPSSTPTLTPHYYPEYTQNHTQTTKSVPTQTTSIVIKPSRAYDPNAVARLKEKLGLSRKEEEGAE